MARTLIRRANRDDLNAILRIEDQSFASPNWVADSFSQYYTVVAERSGQVAGVLVTRDVFGGTEGHFPEIEILNLAVAPEFRRQGVATALLKSLLDRNGTFFLEVRESNIAAQALYQGFHFAVVGYRPKYYQNPVETALLMQRQTGS